jgi:hypothetical protein
MPVRQSLRVVPLIVMLVLVLAGTATGRNRANPCVGRATTVVANPNVRVIRRGAEFWACGKAWRRGHLLGRNGASLTSTQSVSNIRIAGRFVAWATSLQDHENGSFYVNVADAVRGGSHGYQTGSPPPDVLSAGIGPATAVVLQSAGGVAWIAQDESMPNRYEVHAVSAQGRRLLAAGLGIDPKSLASSGATVYWSQDGTAHAAAF